MDVSELAAYLGLAILLYYLLIELTKPREGVQKWASWAFVLGMVLFMGYYLWRRSTQQNKRGVTQEEFSDDEDDSNTEEDNHESYIPTDYITVGKEFSMLNEKKSSSGELTYSDFKEVYLTKAFLDKFTSSVKLSLSLKRKRLQEIRRRYATDLNILQRGEKPKRGIASVLKDLNRHDESKSLEDTIEKLTELVEEAKGMEKLVNVEMVRRNLVSAVTDRNNGIDSLVGLDSVKDFLAKKLYTFAENPRIFYTSFQNIRLYGPAGIGKTKAAQVIGHVFASSGILLRNHVQLTTASEFTTAYVNESSKKTRKLLMSNLESVVFIDEAYGMTPPPSLGDMGRDHGHEAITELVNFTDKMMGISVIIVAGYEDEMEERFMKANQGIPSRFPMKILLHSYTSDELTQILIKSLISKSPDLKITDENANYIYSLVEHVNRHKKEAFMYQGRDMLNLSSHLSEAICSSYGRSWDTSSEEMIMTGFNSFLATKNCSIIES